MMKSILKKIKYFFIYSDQEILIHNEINRVNSLLEKELTYYANFLTDIEPLNMNNTISIKPYSITFKNFLNDYQKFIQIHVTENSNIRTQLDKLYNKVQMLESIYSNIEEIVITFNNYIYINRQENRPNDLKEISHKNMVISCSANISKAFKKINTLDQI